MKQTAPSYWIEDKPYYLAVYIKHAGRDARIHLYFTLNRSFRRAIDKLLKVSNDWLEAGYCDLEAAVNNNPLSAWIKITSASVEHFRLQLACVQCWVNAQDDLVANMHIIQGDGDEDQGRSEARSAEVQV